MTTERHLLFLPGCLLLMIGESVYPNPSEDVLCSPLFSLYGERRSKQMSIESSTSSAKQPTLLRNAIGLPGVLFQSITTMAPASAVAFSLGAAIPFAGGALPLAVPFFCRRERPPECIALLP